MADVLFVSPREAWRRSGLPRDEIHRRLHSGELPSLKLGTRYKVPVKALDILVASLCDETPAEAPPVPVAAGRK